LTDADDAFRSKLEWVWFLDDNRDGVRLSWTLTVETISTMTVFKWRRCRRDRSFIRAVVASGTLCVLCGACGDVFPPVPAPLFTIGLEINGKQVDSAILDTGGGYELMLQKSIGLPVFDEVEVLAFDGPEMVGVAEGFSYTIDGTSFTAQAAIVGISICDCNGVGYLFLRKAGQTLAVDFDANEAFLLDDAPSVGVQIDFGEPPDTLPHFDSAFLTVEVSVGSKTLVLNGLLDTGTNGTVMRRGLFDAPTRPLQPDRLDITIGRDELGVVAANVRLFDTPGLPDIILGTDVMRAWSDRWFFTYAPRGGTVTVEPRTANAVEDILAGTQLPR
jgi:hypothetical protein